MVKYTAYHKEEKHRLVVIDMPDNEKIFPMEVKDKACSQGWFPWSVYEKLRARKATKEDIQRFNEIPHRELKYFCYLCKRMNIKTRHSEDGIPKFVNKEALWSHLRVHHDFDEQFVKMVDLRPYEIKPSSDTF